MKSIDGINKVRTKPPKRSILVLQIHQSSNVPVRLHYKTSLSLEFDWIKNLAGLRENLRNV